MQVGVIGIGKLGLCFSLLLDREGGYRVIGIDNNKDYVTSLNSKSFNSLEPNVNSLLNLSTRFTASTDINEISNCNLIFIFVATPSTSDGSYDHSQIISVLTELNQKFPGKDIVIGCTVMPGFCSSIKDKFPNLTISYSPLFIAQGTIISGIHNPDFILIGEATAEVGNKISEIYSKISICADIKKMSPLEAEITKLSLNCYITTKIAYANMIGDIVKKAGGNADIVLDAISSDSRVGKKCMKYGFGFGGPCFPRDNRALGYFADSLGLSYDISKASDKANKNHLKFMIEDTEANHPKDKPIVLDYVTYKSDSILIDESQQLAYATAMKNKGYIIKILDNRPEVVVYIKDLQ